MPTREDVLAKWKTLLQKKQDLGLYRTAITGDGSDTDNCDIAGRPAWWWVRYDEKQDKASQVRSLLGTGWPQDVPVVIGKRYPFDKEYQVLGLNWSFYYDSADSSQYIQYLLAKHGPSHRAPDGGDPAWIDLRNLIPGRVQSTDPTSMRVYIQAFYYDYNGVMQRWDGGEQDLIGYRPLAVDRHHYVAICLNPATNTITVLTGLAAPLPVVPALPVVPSGLIPLGAALLTQAMVTVEETDIYDIRLLFTGLGDYISAINARVADIESTLWKEIDLLWDWTQRLRTLLADLENQTDRDFTSHVT